MRPVLILLLIFKTILMNSQNQDPWVEYMTPSSVHTLLSQYTGDFKMEITMNTGEDLKPSVVIVDSENKMLLGDRFLEMSQKGIMMGMVYEAKMILGFNNTDKKFALTTMTNMGTGTLSMFGDWDASSNSATLFGEVTNPVSKNSIQVKQIVSYIDKDTILIESFDKEVDSLEKKTIEYKLIRNK